ncbi:MAG: TRL domain-containing protein [Pseudomonadota bacterium]
MTEHRRRTRAGGALRLGTLAALALVLTGCANWPASGHNGAFYTNVTRPVAVLDKQALTTRTGEACTTGILGLYASGNSTVVRAKENAGIEEVHLVEERFTHYFAGIYSKYCTIVSGV